MTQKLSAESPLDLPWLETLSEDWFSQPGSSCSALGPIEIRESQPCGSAAEEQSSSHKKPDCDVISKYESGAGQITLDGLQFNKARNSSSANRSRIENELYSGHLLEVSSPGSVVKPERSRSASLSSPVPTDENSITRQRRCSLSSERLKSVPGYLKETFQDLWHIRDPLLTGGDRTGHRALEHLFQQSDVSTSKLNSSSIYFKNHAIPSSPPQLPTRVNGAQHGWVSVNAELPKDGDPQNKAVGPWSRASFHLNDALDVDSDSAEDRIDNSKRKLGSSSAETCTQGLEIRRRGNDNRTGSDKLSETNELSPVYVSKHSTLDGCVKYSAVEKATLTVAAPRPGDNTNNFGQRPRRSKPESVLESALITTESAPCEQTVHPFETECNRTKIAPAPTTLDEACTRPFSISRSLVAEATHSSAWIDGELRGVSKEDVGMPNYMANNARGDEPSGGNGRCAVKEQIHSRHRISDRYSSAMRNPISYYGIEGKVSRAYSGEQRNTAASSIGKKRKTARYDTSPNSINPESLAKREILTPKHLAPGYNRIQSCDNSKQIDTYHQQEASSLVNGTAYELRRCSSRISEYHGASDNDAPPTVPTTATKIEKSPRQPSVSTQDYLNEAMRVMEFIRFKKHSRGELGDLIESVIDASVLDGSTRGRLTPQSLSRPPSRHGGPSWRRHTVGAVDSSIIAHLRHYEEEEDDERISTGVEERVPQHEVTNEVTNLNNSFSGTEPVTMSRPARSRGSIAMDSQSCMASMLTSTPAQHPQQHGTLGGKKVATIKPSEVAHLMGTDHGKMRFDVVSKRWVRGSSSKPVNQATDSIISTEDDPFDEISDLEVDEKREASRFEPKLTNTTMVHKIISDKSLDQIAEKCARSQKLSKNGDLAKPQKPFYGQAVGPYPMQGQTLLQKTERNILLKKKPTQSTSLRLFDNAGAELNVALRSKSFTNDGISVEDATMLQNDENMIQNDMRESMVVAHSFADPWSRDRLVYHPLKRPGPEDHRSISIVHTNNEGRTMSMSFSVAAPSVWRQFPRAHSSVQRSPTNAEEVFGALTPMSEGFKDLAPFSSWSKELPQNIMKNAGQHFAWAAHSAAIDNLVAKLTEAEPDEPYWDWLTTLCLSSSELDTLYMLGDFCPRIQNLDVCQNRLRYLDGLPRSVRQLNVDSNHLSSLTGWSHLLGLQYLDVSDNRLNDLEGLAQLTNLRELRADRNCISSLEGILDLSGLLCLSVAGNRIQSIDFTNSSLSRLNSLCLSGNKAQFVSNIENLKSIQILDLRNNRLKHLWLGSSNTVSMFDLKTVDLDNNDITILDISRTPNLEKLSADGNCIVGLIGLVQHPGLHTLSLRHQKTYEAAAAVGNMWKDFYELRHLYLSGNVLSTIQMPEAFLNLHTLEIAHSGILALHPKFGDLTPNLRSLDLSHNSIKDIRSLRSLRRLRKLTLRGNNIVRLRRTMVVIGGLSQLEELDLRDNPVTEEFRAPRSAHSEDESSIAKNKSAYYLRGNTQEKYPSSTARKAVGLRLQHEAEESIRLKRKVYELLLAAQCRNLTFLDGVECHACTMMEKDADWNKLLEMGVIVRTPDHNT